MWRNPFLPFCLNHLSLFPLATPCQSQACQWVSTRLSMSDDPFSQPCDYFLFTCGSDRFSPNSRGAQTGQGITEHPQDPNEGEERRGQRNRGRDWLSEEKKLGRKTVLLHYLREILGRSPQQRNHWFGPQWTCDLTVWSVFFCVCQNQTTSQEVQRCRRPEDSTTPVWTPHL